ncbi:MAG TPA: SRPBCC family protein [Chitinophagaceae bacterium]|nr:SRPBCC family protein [Chitinophagaceae bacterium]
MAVYQFKSSQFIPATLAQVWDFISAPENLSRITPPAMGFEITHAPPQKSMYPGMIIVYRVRPLWNIPVQWMTEITHVSELEFFVDEQRKGPYTLWHHQHRISPHAEGVLMEDIVTYIPPFGWIGAIANTLLIKGKLKQIFTFRHQAVEQFFSKK